MPMKVTVCFGRVKVLVPCGDGNLLVREVIEKAITRYKKAVGKAVDYWVSVHSLQTSSEGSILDPDDTLCDVVDDREQLIADFEEQGGGSGFGNGDGASTCSTGTTSPDIFHSDVINSKHFRGYSLDDGHDVVVTPRDIATGSGLTVRRGSEPSLTISDEKKSNTSDGPPKKLSNGIDDAENNNIINNDVSSNNSKNNNNNSKTVISNNSQGEKSYYDAEHTRSLERNPFKRVHQDTWRQSLGNQPSMFRWFDAAERQEDRFKQTELERKEPVGESTENTPNSEEPSKDDQPEKPRPARVLPPLPPHAKHREAAILICLKNDGTALGIHVVPDFTEDGKECGLMVQSIEPGGRISKDGRLRVDDRIVEINEQTLHEVSFQKAQEIFRNAMKTDEVRLRVVKHSVAKKAPPAILPKPKAHTPVKPSPLTLSSLSADLESLKSSPDDTSTPLDKISQSSSNEIVSSPSETPKSPSKSPLGPQSPFKKTPPIPPQRHPSTTLTNSNSSTSSNPNKPRKLIIAPTNTKKIGKKIEIQLVKDSSGLGFSITTRDNPAVGDSPIYIKNILPEGAAVVDGRLKPGDRLLEVNGVDMTGKTQADAVSILRNTRMGSTVFLVVSRQEVEDERFKVPRQLNTSDLDTTPPLLQSHEKAGDDGTLAVMQNKELLEFDIPLNDTGSAGLGVSVKGKTLTTEEGTRDLGVFVKAVIHGGAASKDGRLQVNDQLLEVNGNSLKDLSNTESMDVLRKAMQEEGPVPGCINIKVARRIGAPSPSPFSQTSPGVFDSTDSATNSPLDRNIGDSLTSSEYSSPEKTHKPFSNMGDLKSPNLFLERVLAGNGLRNESYMRAAHESYTENPDSPGQNKAVLSEGSSSGIERHSSYHSNSSSSEDLHREPAWLQGPDWANRHASVTSEEELSPAGDGFHREGFGRQSMSEKRKGHIDPRTMETYQSLQRNKGANKDSNKGLQRSVQQSGSYGRLVRAGSAESLISCSNSSIFRGGNARSGSGNEPPPASNLKRFSSLENLSSAQFEQENDKSTSFDEEGDVLGQPRMARKRGGNESFRAAVDRSYDPVPVSQIEMDPSNSDDHQHLPLRRSKSVEEESSEGGSLSREAINSARSSISDHQLAEDKKKGHKKNKDNRKSTGILKGIFKFGRGRKTPDEHLTKGEGDKHDERDMTDRVGPFQDQQHRQQVWRDTQPNYDRQDPLLRPQEVTLTVPQPHNYYIMNRVPADDENGFHPEVSGFQPYYSGSQFQDTGTQLDNTGAPLSRAEKIQQLRANHQRRHRERQGHYPMEDKEEEYERQIQEEEKRVYRYSTDDYVLQKYGISAIPGQNPEFQGQRVRPLSRNQERPTSHVAVSESSLPNKNYQDYSDINNYPHGNVHVSDSNIQQGFFRPQSRGGATSSSDFSHSRGPISSTSSDQARSRGPAPQAGHQFREPTTVQDQRVRGPTPSAVDQRLRGQTPTNFDQGFRRPTPEPGFRGPTPDQGFRGPTPTQEWYHSDNRNVQKQFSQPNRENISSQKQGYSSRNGGFYGNANMTYRDPVLPIMAGKRPVKTLGQPNSAKV